MSTIEAEERSKVRAARVARPTVMANRDNGANPADRGLLPG
jgi:hypothetical protein